MKLTVLVLGVAVALFIAQVESFGFGFSGCVGLFSLFLIPGAGLGCAVWGMAKRKSHMVTRGIGLIVAPLLALVAAIMTTRAQEEASKRRGDELCQALEAFRQATGEYPETLDALVPKFIPTVPVTCMSLLRSLPFYYSRQKGVLDYRLAFDSTNFIECQRSRNGGWRCDD